MNSSKAGEGGGAPNKRGRLLLQTIESLQLNNNGIKDLGVADLAAGCRKVSPCPLKKLWLGGNDIADMGVSAIVALSEAGTLPKLESLLLYSNSFSDSSMEMLATFCLEGCFAQLQRVCLQNQVNVSRRGRSLVSVAMANAALPGGKGSPHLTAFC